MNDLVHAIETKYKGYRFRSRLEARWAIFLDELRVAWEYEKEGYDLGEAGWYLPDFWLPDFESFMEVKPNLGAVAQASTKVSALCRLAPVIVTATTPGSTAEAPAILFDHVLPDSVSSYAFHWLYTDRPLGLLLRNSDCYIWRGRHDFFFLGQDVRAITSSLRGAIDNDVTRAAHSSARAARFEFGETPAAQVNIYASAHQ